MSVDELRCVPSNQNEKSSNQDISLLLRVHGYASCYGSKLMQEELRRSNSLGSIETTKKNVSQLSLPTGDKPTDDVKESSCLKDLKMPKRTTPNERKTSSRLFRSMSLSRGKQSNKEQNASDDRRNSSISVSDSEKVTILMDHNAQLLDERNESVEENSKIKKDLEDANFKLKVAERELENLNELLSSRIKQKSDINCAEDASDKRTRISDFSDLRSEENQGQKNNVIFPSKVEHLETTIEANAVPVHKLTPCKECARLKESRIKAVVEAIALRKYVKNLNDALSGGDTSKQKFLRDVEKKLISAQTEKEVALEELANVVDHRNQAVAEKDRAVEEWGKAQSKWETTLDQVDSLMKELNQVKSERDDLAKKLKRKDDVLEKIKQETSLLSEQIEVTKKERRNSVNGYDVSLKEKYEKEESIRKLTIELTKSQQRCIEMDARVTSLEEKEDNYKKERDHAKEQWRQSVKERKRLHREMAGTVQARDEAIQKCFSTAEQLEKLKEEYNHLLNRLAKTGLNTSNSSELSIPCSLKDCKFCADDSAGSLESPDSSFTEGEEIRVTLEKDDALDSIKVVRVSCQGRPFTAIIDIDKSLGVARNIRKYDEIVSINDIPVTESDQNLVKSLLDGAMTALNMVLKRPVGTCQISFDLDLKVPKKVKTGLGFECGLYVKELKHGFISEDQNTLEEGDYVMKVNGKHLDKIIASSLEKVTKKSGEKLKLHVTRTVNARLKRCEFKPIYNNDSGSDTVVLRRLSRSSVDNNRLSLISNDSSISRDSRFSGNSSVGSVSSYTDSCMADSNSDICGNRFSGFFLVDRPRTATAIFSPSSDPQLKTIKAEESSDEGTGTRGDDSQNTSDAKESDTEEYGTLKPKSHFPINRKFVSTSQLQSGTFLTAMGVDGALVRAQSTITAIRVDDDGLSTGLLRPSASTCETLVPLGESPRIIRLEKKPLDGLGLEVSGGYRIGIYVIELQEDSVCKTAGLQVGDRLLKLNSYDLSKATLDHATRIVRLLNTCTYLRIEAQQMPNYEEILEDTPYDSLYVRTIHAYKAMAPDELSFTVGETLHVINTRANYDQARQSWKWVAQRTRKDEKVLEEGLVPSMGSIPEHAESTVLSQTLQRFESESDEQATDEAPCTLKRASTERRSLLQRYRKLMRRESRDSMYNTDENGNTNKVTYYEILSKISD